MFTLEGLETALLARWGREEMTVYADYLQSIGDPRGEVIAIDLVNLDTVDEAAWRTRRHDAIAAWLGEDLATRVGPMLFQGFVQEAGTDTTLLASPAGEFVRAARLGTDLDAIQRVIERPRPWLTRLAITCETTQPPLLDETTVDKLIAATPRLDELVLRGHGIAERFSHPNVRHIRFDGAVVSELGWRGMWLTPSPQFAIETVRDESGNTRLYLDGSEPQRVLAQPVLQKHVTHVRYSGEAQQLSRIVEVLPALAVVETTATGQHLQALERVLSKFPRVVLAYIER